MAKQIAGEVEVDLVNGKAKLRLEIESMLELEALYGVGSVRLISDVIAPMRTRNLAILLLAMTGKDFSDEVEIDQGIRQVLENGPSKIATALTDCLTKTLTSGLKSPGKRKAANAPQKGK